MRVLIIGGVAAGASCAARLRRQREDLDIQVFDRGPFVSFANCGLPYYVGDVITDEKKLVVATPELFRDRFNIAVHLRHEIIGIDRAARTVTVRDLAGGGERVESYDALVIAPGAVPLLPELPGRDLPGVFGVRTIPDSRKVREWIATRAPQRAVVVGAGFVGLEMAENLVHRGLQVTVVERGSQVVPPVDPEIATVVADHLTAKGLTLVLDEGLSAIEAGAGGVATTVVTDKGRRIPADLVILGLGVRPEVTLARACGLELGARGGIRVDAHQQTSDPAIWAVGDACEVADVVDGQPTVVPLAGPANRQGRVAANAIAGHPERRSARFRGVQATAVCGLFGLTVASTGASEKALRRAGRSDFACVHLHPGHHVGYFPGARPIHLKLIYDTRDGRVLGAQAAGEEGVEKRIDVIAMAIQMRATVHDLAEAELCYAPQFGAAKDPVNVAGMIAANVLDGDVVLADWSTLGTGPVLDVREPSEFAAGHLPTAFNIPLHSLRTRYRELPPGPLPVVCGVGQRAYYAVRLLRQHGIDARLLSGGMATARLMGGR